MSSPHISRSTLAFFRHIVYGYFRRSFRAVRVSEPERFAALPAGPLIVYANHSSWWDPMVLVLLAAKLMPRRRHFAPMDANALERYGILKRVGIFGVDMHSVRGAARFLRTGIDILTSGGVLWVTPQGRFADARERPLLFKAGMAALAAKIPGGCTVLPLAIEYVFWDERLPETLLHFGHPVHIEGRSTEEADALLRQALLETMQTLKEKAMARDPAAFTVLHGGKVGTGGFYELGQRIFARVRGRTYQPEHTRIPAPAPEARG